mgnify:CR=1 FL=1
MEAFGCEQPAVMYRYSTSKSAWVEEHKVVTIEAECFAQGGMRKAFRMKVKGDRQKWVMKFYKDRFLSIIDPEKQAKADAEMQAEANVYARQWNIEWPALRSEGAPKKVIPPPPPPKPLLSFSPLHCH